MPLQVSGIFDKIERVQREIANLYQAWDQPWLIGMSMGADSSVAAQLVYQTVEALPVHQRANALHFIIGDTMTETYQIEQRIKRTATAVRAAAVRDNMPAYVHVTRPHVAESLFVMICGRGYAAPTVKNR